MLVKIIGDEQEAVTVEVKQFWKLLQRWIHYSSVTEWKWNMERKVKITAVYRHGTRRMEAHLQNQNGRWEHRFCLNGVGRQNDMHIETSIRQNRIQGGKEVKTGTHPQYQASCGGAQDWEGMKREERGGLRIEPNMLPLRRRYSQRAAGNMGTCLQGVPQ